MKPWHGIAVVVIPGLAAFLGVEDQDTRKARRPPKGARHLVQMENWVRGVKIETKESAPPQFDVILKLAMPTPGWKLQVDKVEKPDTGHRIKVSITGTRPKGMMPQVITNAEVRVRLGSLPKGRYLLDVYGRHEAAGSYQRRGVALVHAFDRWGE